jgi:hypothetical protein
LPIGIRDRTRGIACDQAVAMHSPSLPEIQSEGSGFVPAFTKQVVPDGRFLFAELTA